MKIGDAVTYVDPHGQERPAILTAVWDGGTDTPTPSVNLVFISDDEARTDSYGRQIERQTSVPHEANQFAHGNYWK